ncbi:hypothetical protein, partial [Nocardia abscessus]|uniref:hypothetical protein n=1 Tax=Nocardia abscessus TaxID=120957 RepID=UPI002454445E
MAVRTSVPVPEFAREILAESRIEGHNLVLPQQLSQADYRKINRVIESMGGRWNRRARAHVFPDDPTETIGAAGSPAAAPPPPRANKNPHKSPPPPPGPPPPAGPPPRRAA